MPDTIGRKYKYEGNHISILIPMTSDLDSLLFHWNALRLPLQGAI